MFGEAASDFLHGKSHLAKEQDRLVEAAELTDMPVNRSLDEGDGLRLVETLVLVSIAQQALRPRISHVPQHRLFERDDG